MEINVNKELVDVIAEKFGMFIDWTAENVVPQVMDILMRYRTYEIVTNGIELIIGFILIVWSLLIIRRFCKEMDTTINNFPERKPYQSLSLKYTEWWTNSDCEVKLMDVKIIGILMLIFAGVAIIAGPMMFFGTFKNIMEWLIIPEIQFYNLFVGA